MLRFVLTLPILLAACPRDETISGYADTGADYVLEELNGAAFPARATIRFPVRGDVTGEGPCLPFRARQNAPYPWIEIDRIAVPASRRVCPEMAAEQRYFEALAAARLAEVLGEVLILSNDDGLEMVFRAAQD